MQLSSKNIYEKKNLLIEQIDQWGQNSIDKIKQTAQQCRDKWIHHSTQFLCGIENKLNDLAREIKDIFQENEFNEIDLNKLKQSLEKLQEELDRPTNFLIEQELTAAINKVVLRLSSQEGISKII